MPLPLSASQIKKTHTHFQAIIGFPSFPKLGLSPLIYIGFGAQTPRSSTVSEMELILKSFICNLQVFYCLIQYLQICLSNKSMMDNSSIERRPWSQEEDQALRSLYEGLQANKWNLIAQKLQTEFGFLGRSGKQCRQRYNNHLDPCLSRDEWSPSEELALFRLHDQLGNKWAVISQRLSTGRTDNAIKNHFYSRLRKSLRRLNKLIAEKYKKSMRDIRPQVLYKIIEAAEEAFKEDPMCSSQLSQLGCELKNRILMVTDLDEEQDEAVMRGLIEKINEFNLAYKRKPKKLRRNSCYSGRDDDEIKFLPPRLPSSSSGLPRVTSFSSLSHRNSISCLLDDEENAKIEIKTEESLKPQIQKLISPIILTCLSASNLTSEKTLEGLGLVEEEMSSRQAECSELKNVEESSTEAKAEPFGLLCAGRPFTQAVLRN